MTNEAIDLGLEADSILGFLGVGLFAYGLGAGHFGIALVGAGVAGWFGGWRWRASAA